MNSELPKGIYSFEDMYGIPYEEPKPKCTCGWSITLGKDDIPEGHPNDCELKKSLLKAPKIDKIEPVIT